MASNASWSKVSPAASAGLPPLYSVHHTAIGCLDAEKTRQFYEDILGLDLTAAQIVHENRAGKEVEMVHFFFRMADGDFLAFFDSTDAWAPGYRPYFEPIGEMDLRKGLEVSSEEDLLAIADRLSKAGVDFTGPVERGLVKKISFKDPSGIDLEVAAPMPGFESALAEEKKRAKAVLADWIAKNAA